jgi:hypothetical protein
MLALPLRKRQFKGLGNLKQRDLLGDLVEQLDFDLYRDTKVLQDLTGFRRFQGSSTQYKGGWRCETLGKSVQGC